MCLACVPFRGVTIKRNQQPPKHVIWQLSLRGRGVFSPSPANNFRQKRLNAMKTIIWQLSLGGGTFFRHPREKPTDIPKSVIATVLGGTSN